MLLKNLRAKTIETIKKYNQFNSIVPCIQNQIVRNLEIEDPSLVDNFC